MGDANAVLTKNNMPKQIFELFFGEAKNAAGKFGH